MFLKKSVLSRFWIHLSVFPNKLYIKIKLNIQAFQLYNYLLTEIIIKRIIWHQRLIIFSPFCSLKKSVLSRFWIHLLVFPNRFYIKIKLIVQAFQLYNCLLTEIIMKRIIWHQRLIIFSPFCSAKKSVLSIFWIHLSVFPDKLYIKIKLIVQAFQIYNYLSPEIIIKRIIWHQRREHW